MQFHKGLTFEPWYFGRVALKAVVFIHQTHGNARAHRIRKVSKRCFGRGVRKLLKVREVGISFCHKLGDDRGSCWRHLHSSCQYAQTSLFVSMPVVPFAKDYFQCNLKLIVVGQSSFLFLVHQCKQGSNKGRLKRIIRSYSVPSSLFKSVFVARHPIVRI